jgi:ubiquinone/menaquinone biosynthesis C-methylase UbiE
MEFEEIKNYWNERAGSDSTSQSTTNDVFLRAIESSKLIETINELNLKQPEIVDIGCGDGNTTISVAKSFSEWKFKGFDYSENMIKNASTNLKSVGLNNLDFDVLDISQKSLSNEVDLIFTSRCLINLPGWELQCKALDHIRKSLKTGGYYLMIENFLDGHNEFNKVRKQFDLPEIPVRPHNYFFDQNKLNEYAKNKFEIVSIRNISSMYYLVSRIVYSKICQIRGENPDYFDLHHELGSQLPECGNFGPIKLLILRRL